MFGDGENDNEVNTVYVNSIQFRDGAMTAEQAAALGAATADGIPIPPPSNTAVTLNYVRNGDKLTLSWDVNVTGFSLESADILSNPNWSIVPNVTNNSVTITIDRASRFFRLRKI